MNCFCTQHSTTDFVHCPGEHKEEQHFGVAIVSTGSGACAKNTKIEGTSTKEG
jgi:hypothetical protein